jgi:hypothetical protein
LRATLSGGRKTLTKAVIPAEAGIQGGGRTVAQWIPAFPEMTGGMTSKFPGKAPQALKPSSPRADPSAAGK